MRTTTKTLLGLAALAAGVATSMAQNVYSLNIVGYANVSAPPGQYAFHVPPFQVTTAVTNGLNEILPANTGQFDGDQVFIFTGTAFGSVYLDSSKPTGFSDSGGTQVGAPIVNMGQSYVYLNNQGPSAYTNLTYVGQVRTGTNTINIPVTPTYHAIGSPTPFAGGLKTVLQFANPGTYDGDAAQILSGGKFGAVFFDSTSSTGFSNSGGTPVPEPQIAVGQGFIFDNEVGPLSPPITWSQVFNP